MDVCLVPLSANHHSPDPSIIVRPPRNRSPHGHPSVRPLSFPSPPPRVSPVCRRGTCGPRAPVGDCALADARAGSSRRSLRRCTLNAPRWFWCFVLGGAVNRSTGNTCVAAWMHPTSPVAYPENRVRREAVQRRHSHDPPTPK
jgi:hypothetical protein